MISNKTLSLFSYFSQAAKAQSEYKDVKLAQKGPYTESLKAGDNFLFCQCGYAREKSQPYCDGTHKTLKHLDIPKQLKFSVEKDGEYQLCGCKTSKNFPFCDGSHENL